MAAATEAMEDSAVNIEGEKRGGGVVGKKGKMREREKVRDEKAREEESKSFQEQAQVKAERFQRAVWRKAEKSFFLEKRN